jgi:hypothetical protein
MDYLVLFCLLLVARAWIRLPENVPAPFFRNLLDLLFNA